MDAEETSSGLFFDRGERVLVVRFGREMTAEAVNALRAAVRGFVAAEGSCRLIIDLSAVESAPVPGQFIADLARRGPIVAKDMRVFVAPKPELFGLSRMYELHQIATADVTLVVETMAEALEALGVDTLDLAPVVGDADGGA